MHHLKANTQVIVTVGPFVAVGDGFTPVTGIALGAADQAEIIKHGSTSVTDISGATWAAVTDCDGYYSLTLNTSHTNTEGMLTVVVQDASECLPVRIQCMILAEAAYDSLYVEKDTGYMDVNIKAISEDTTASDNLESACDNYSVTRGLSGTALPAKVADAAGGLPISDAGGLDLDAIKTKTDNLPSGIKKNTALSNFEFLMLDTNDDPKTGLTVTSQRSIDGAAFAACANSASELSNGVYKINLADTDLNGDVVTLRFTAAAAKARLITIVTNT